VVSLTLEYATGTVQELADGAWKGLGACSDLRAGGEVRTLEQSKCELSLRDGTLLRLDESTQLRFDHARAITLRKGELWAKVAGPTPFRVTTDDGPVELEGGTYDISYRLSTRHPSKFDPPQLATSLAVLDGRGRIADQNLTPLMSCVVEQKVADTPVPIEPLLRTRWIHELLKLRDRNDPETAERVTALLARLGRTKTPQAYESEIRGLGDRSVPALLRLVTKLPEPLSAYDRRNAMRLLADLAGPSEVEGLVALTSDADGEIWSSANVALIRITGQSLKGGDAWKAWYDESRKASAPKK
jgi:hypothetical protein